MSGVLDGHVERLVVMAPYSLAIRASSRRTWVAPLPAVRRGRSLISDPAHGAGTDAKLARFASDFEFDLGVQTAGCTE